MNNPTRLLKNQGLALIVALMLGLMTGLTACGGGGSKDKVLPDQDASGLFKDGTADLDGGSTLLNDLRGFVHEGV